MLRTAVIVGTLALAGCVESTPPPEVQKLMAACDAGNLQACAAVAQVREANRANRIAAAQAYQPPVFTPLPQPTPMRTYNMPAPRQTRCTPTIGGGMNCTSY